MARASTGQVEQRRARVFAAIVAGKTLRDIMAVEGVSDTTLTADVRAITEALHEHAQGEIRTAMAAAIATYQRVIDEAWRGYDEAWQIMRAWLAGDYDRTAEVPDPDGGTHTERKPPMLKLEMATYLDKVISATQKLTKMAGVEGADQLHIGGADGGPIVFTLAIDRAGGDGTDRAIEGHVPAPLALPQADGGAVLP